MFDTIYNVYTCNYVEKINNSCSVNEKESLLICKRLFTTET